MFFTEVHTKKGGSFKNRLLKDYSRNQKNFFSYGITAKTTFWKLYFKA